MSTKSPCPNCGDDPMALRLIVHRQHWQGGLDTWQCWKCGAEYAVERALVTEADWDRIAAATRAGSDEY